MTIKNLEIFTSSYNQDHSVSLYGTLDVCQTRSGSKLLRYILAHPLRDSAIIHDRLGQIQHHIDHSDRMLTIRQLLGQLIDIHSCLTTIIYKTTNYHPFIRLRKTLDLSINGIDGYGICQELFSLKSPLVKGGQGESASPSLTREGWGGFVDEEKQII
ncbi:hypothetical protein KAZ93_03505 [Patescibacteria group bacterium]|nr:hypothetical protein [Patescibacteria group bacterium]